RGRTTPPAPGGAARTTTRVACRSLDADVTNAFGARRPRAPELLARRAPLELHARARTDRRDERRRVLLVDRTPQVRGAAERAEVERERTVRGARHRHERAVRPALLRVVVLGVDERRRRVVVALHVVDRHRKLVARGVVGLEGAPGASVRAE